MKILNLTNNETSDIKFEVSRFPDGQQQVTITDLEFLTQKNKKFWAVPGKYSTPHSANVYGQYNLPSKPIKVQLKARLNDFKDLELIVCAVASLKELGIKEIHLYTPYFMGARSDRKFKEGSNNYLKHVICPMINALNLSSVGVIDGHSDVLEACLNNYVKIDNVDLVKFALNDIVSSKEDYSKWSFDDVVVVSPDAGAMKKIYNVAEKIKYDGGIVIASKHRNPDGTLSDVRVNLFAEQYTKDIIIIDDICDGGRTFIEIAKKIQGQCPMQYKLPKIYLIVTHGVFSNKFGELSRHFERIYCTNSYSNILKWQENDGRIITANSGKGDFIKQMNVF